MRFTEMRVSKRQIRSLSEAETILIVTSTSLSDHTSTSLSDHTSTSLSDHTSTSLSDHTSTSLSGHTSTSLSDRVFWSPLLFYDPNHK